MTYKNTKESLNGTVENRQSPDIDVPGQISETKDKEPTNLIEIWSLCKMINHVEMSFRNIHQPVHRMLNKELKIEKEFPACEEGFDLKLNLSCTK